jgi:hypothetical protein
VIQHRDAVFQQTSNQSAENHPTAAPGRKELFSGLIERCHQIRSEGSVFAPLATVVTGIPIATQFSG